MQSFGNWSIRSKAMVIPGLLAILVLLLGASSFLLLSSTNDATLKVGGNWMPSQRVAGEIETMVARRRLIAVRIALADTPEALDVGLKLDGPARQRLSGLLTRYKTDLIANDADRAALEALSREVEKQDALDDQVIAASRAGKHAEAMQLYMSGQPQFVTTMDAGDKLLSLNQSGAESEMATAKGNYHAALLVIAVTSAVALLVAALSFLILTRTVAAPIRAITGRMHRLAKNELSITIDEAGRRDEIGEMAEALQVFRDNMVETERLRAAQAAEQEQRLQRSRAVEQLVGEFDRSISAVIGTVGAATAALDRTARSMTATADATNSQVTVVAAAAEEASSNVQTVAAAAEELSSSINEIGRQVAESARFAHQATEQAHDTDRQIASLSEAAARIGDVVQLINDIASQTNLLALNATIEAARAGDAGKGFAVVAGEVKTLANQTARASGEISDKVNEMQAATAQSVEAVKAIATTIGHIAQIATGIAAAVDEQNAATGEIARNVQQAAQGTSEVSSSIIQVAQGAAQTGSAAGDVLKAAETLERDGESLRSQIDGFMARIKAV